MKALKESMSEEIANIPEELLKKAYSYYRRRLRGIQNRRNILRDDIGRRK